MYVFSKLKNLWAIGKMCFVMAWDHMSHGIKTTYISKETDETYKKISEDVYGCPMTYKVCRFNYVHKHHEDVAKIVKLHHLVASVNKRTILPGSVVSSHPVSIITIFSDTAWKLRRNKHC